MDTAAAGDTGDTVIADSAPEASGCPSGQKLCGSSCVQLTANANCGDCGVVCPATQTCSAMHCLLIDGQPCTIGAACATGVCSPFYVDADGDGYGTSATASFCGVTAPTGYASRNGDCCDSNPMISPAADYHTAIGSCNGTMTWDYNCNGVTDYQQLQPYTLPNGCTSGSVCPGSCIQQNRMETTLVACGASAGGAACSSSCTGTGACFTTGIVAFVQGCK